MKFGIFYEHQLPRPWTETSEYDLLQQSLEQCALADELGLVGLVALELFVTKEGRVLANEMAPRPHNSGHWTIDACATSQFEQLVRAICGLPLGPVDVIAPSRMENLIGDEANDWLKYVSDPTARLHLYGKSTPRPGRKMGHVTFIDPK